MARPRIITLLTDFGEQDGYVAAMKGVILAAAQEPVTLIDAAHHITPQDVAAAAWALRQYWRFYPEGTIHVAVVDPGVGAGRRAVLATSQGHWFLAPDNGLLTLVDRQVGGLHARFIHPDWHRPGGVAATFHGRDVFAYAAGLLAAGHAPPESLAAAGAPLVRAAWSAARTESGVLHAQVIHVDRFGNLITNITRADLAGWNTASLSLAIGNAVVRQVVPAYAAAPPGDLLALFGSEEFLEVAVRDGSAAARLGLGRGATLAITP